MWKVVAVVLAVFAIGHLAVRYLRKNPLAPEVEGRQVVVTSQDYEVHYERSGPVEGTYYVSGAESRDFTDRPVNAILWVVDADSARGYMRGYPDFHLYGSESGERLCNVASPLAVVASSSATYGDVVRLLDQHERRTASRAERLCVTLTGEALSPVSAVALDSGRDDPGAAQRLTSETPVVFATGFAVADCVDALSPRSP